MWPVLKTAGIVCNKMAAGSVLCRSAKVLSLTCLLVCLLVLLIETSVKSEKYDIYVSKQLRMNDEYHLFNRVSIRPANNFGFKSRTKRYLAAGYSIQLKAQVHLIWREIC